MMPCLQHYVTPDGKPKEGEEYVTTTAIHLDNVGTPQRETITSIDRNTLKI